ncbi:MAG: hypothetical protein CVV64_01185 [Candidatus Wallbacteria bacterium HGW-Wallbacteria-1]|jgi:spoIIIJ-associated protein|uniref:RNA-binding protein KhpB n=1 Tax=Candidatus Wallbacteria bacterium HGW-Wallbacteria-1 TaxID=2013854 RepID=A0A2N1PUN7_9BACT|nr:MAG: hypothetical protein CVV64_01185 [Candidatus Wallbacteria bacterium HGW-Wallbacteria-1]
MVSPRTVEKQAETVEEAVALARQELGVAADQEVSVEVLENGNPGFFFGFGSRKARVKVSIGVPAEARKPARGRPATREKAIVRETPEVIEREAAPLVERREFSDADRDMIRGLIVDFLAVLSEKLGVELHKEIIFRGITVYVNVEGDEVASLIGRKGQTLSAIQYLLSVMISRRVEGKIDVALDISGYRARRRSSLERMARDAARTAERTGREVAMEPMDASERKIIHMAVRNMDGVETTSVGEGMDRKVLVVPRSAASQKDDKARSRRRPRRRKPRQAGAQDDQTVNSQPQTETVYSDGSMAEEQV